MRTRLSTIILLAFGLAACTVDNQASVQLFAICFPPDSCSFGSQCDQIALGNPGLDLARSDRLELFIEVRNQLSNNASTASGQVNTNDAYVQEVAVEYAGISVPGFSHRLQQTVPADGSTVVKVLPITSVRAAAIGTAIGANTRSIIAKVRLKGVYANGSEFETAPWEIPVTVCNGCNNIGVGCPAGQNLTNVCPQQGQAPATATCQ